MRDSRLSIYLAPGVVAVGVLVVSLPAATQAAPLDLPPRPTPLPTLPMPPRPTPDSPYPMPPRPGPTPTPLPSPSPTPLPSGEVSVVEGAYIELWAEFGDEDMGWTVGSWQDLWTVVQWQDCLNDWHDVVEWQGTLDSYKAGVAWKVWWVDAHDFGKGPFRWVVYGAEDEGAMLHSAEFSLPHSIGERVVTEVSLRQ